MVAILAAALSDRREHAGLTQEERAECADVSARFVSFLETGRRQPALSAIHAICTGRGIRMQNLIAEVKLHPEHREGRPEKAPDRT